MISPIQAQNTQDRNKFYQKAMTAGSVGVLLVGVGSVSRQCTKLRSYFRDEMMKPEYYHYLSKTELPAVKKLLNRGLTVEELNRFSRIWKIENKEQFAQEALDFIIGNSGYKHMKPQLTFKPDADSSGSWNYIHYNINIADVNNQSKISILNTLKHEFEHLKQFILMLRTEGIGAERIWEGRYERLYNALKNDTKFASTRSDEEIMQIAKDITNKELDILKLRESVVKRVFGTVKRGTPEAQTAERYLEAKKNYVHINRLSKYEELKAYFDNELEKSAFAAGDIESDKYLEFIMAIVNAGKKS